MPVDLLFRQPLGTSHPVDLIFGEIGSGDADHNVSFNVTLAAPQGVFDLAILTRYGVEFSVTLPEPASVFNLVYDLAVTTGPQARAAATWQKATPTAAATRSGYSEGTRLHPDRQAPWGTGTRRARAIANPWVENTPLPRERRGRWQEATRRPSEDAPAPWHEAARRHVNRDATWQEAARLVGPLRVARWQEMARTSRPTHTLSWQEATALRRSWISAFTEAVHRRQSREAPWQEARHAPPGRSVFEPPIPPEPEPCYEPPAGDEVHLVFRDPWTGTTNLIFSCGIDDEEPPALVVVPIRRVYMQINDTSLWRVDGDVHVPTYSMSMSLDVDSWTWSFSASVPAQALSTIEPEDGTPVELEVRLNGTTFRVLAEQLSRDRVHGNSRVTVRGRSKAAFLDAPYAPIQNFGSDTDLTAQQLMAAVLTTNGVSIGWDIDWQLTDWLVPGGTWAGQGTFIQGVNTIAAAAGAYVQPHRTDQELRVLPRYPVAPWDWATEVEPDFELPAAVAQREAIEWIEKVRYNRVFVQGQVNGVIGQVTRTGTAGDVVAQMVVDPLITHADAARQRGIPVLADTGRQARVTIKLPVLDETGVIEPGNFVRFVDGATTRLGIVRSTSLDIGHPDVWQTLALETHPS